jgi:hypothetical protein
MTVSRRKFLKAGTMLSLSAVIPLKSAFAQQQSAERNELFKVPDDLQADQFDRFTEESFSRYLNTQFRVYTSPLTAVSFELIKVKRWERSPDEKSAHNTKLDCFSVVFRGPRNVALESGTYKVEHDQMGTFELFISPVDERKKQRRYQAVFNHLQQQ